MSNIHPKYYTISQLSREKLLRHKPLIIWFTGLSGSGKSSIADALEQLLHENKVLTINLDGDNLRNGLNKDLGFTEEDRSENIRRIAELCKILCDSGLVVLAAFVSPFSKDRNSVKSLVGTESFLEIYVETSLEECERRDVKGLYAKARSGQISNFTGIDSPYEIPEHPSLIINTEQTSIEDAVKLLYNLVLSKIRPEK